MFFYSHTLLLSRFLDKMLSTLKKVLYLIVFECKNTEFYALLSKIIVNKKLKH